MKVWIDGQEFFDMPAETDTASVLESVKASLAKSGRVATEIRVDGVLMDEDAFADLTEGLQAHFSSQPVRTLVKDSLDEALRYIPRLRKGLEEIAEHFEGSEFSRGQSKLADAAEGLDWLLLVFHNCRVLLGAGEEAEGPGLEEIKTSLFENINLLNQLFEEKKYLQMALCIRENLLGDIEKFSFYVQELHDLSSAAIQ